MPDSLRCWSTTQVLRSGQRWRLLKLPAWSGARGLLTALASLGRATKIRERSEISNPEFSANRPGPGTLPNQSASGFRLYRSCWTDRPHEPFAPPRAIRPSAAALRSDERPGRAGSPVTVRSCLRPTSPMGYLGCERGCVTPFHRHSGRSSSSLAPRRTQRRSASSSSMSAAPGSCRAAAPCRPSAALGSPLPMSLPLANVHGANGWMMS